MKVRYMFLYFCCVIYDVNILAKLKLDDWYRHVRFLLLKETCKPESLQHVEQIYTAGGRAGKQINSDPTRSKMASILETAQSSHLLSSTSEKFTASAGINVIFTHPVQLK